jgi:hypothetical protein
MNKSVVVGIRDSAAWPAFDITLQSALMCA